jgi:catechol 2,3-dioxygenase
VHLTVADLERSEAFYTGQVGLSVLARDATELTLGADRRPLLVLEEEPGATPARGGAGLFHSALLLPERADLARWLLHAIRDRVALTGLSDHFVSEAIYLDDPDGHGIEIYADRPRSLWEGQVAERITVVPLDVDALLGSLDEQPGTFYGVPRDTQMGHIHLRVSDVEASIGFYRDVLGFELMADLGPDAAFFGAGGYHHHIGANTWDSRGAPVSGPGAARLRKATVLLPDGDSLGRVADRLSSAGCAPETSNDTVLVRDPSGIALALQVGVG